MEPLDLAFRIALATLGGGMAATLWPFAQRCARAGEARAARITLRIMAGLLIVYGLAAVAPAPVAHVLGVPLLLLPPMALAAFYLATRPRRHGVDPRPLRPFDERDNVFCRNALKPGSPAFVDYYERHPERLETDDRFRALPGLFGRESTFFQPYLYAAGRSMLDAIYRGLYNCLDGPPSEFRETPDPAAAARYVKELATRLGAHSVGITPIRDYHVFTHAGYGRRHGEPIALEHPTAIVFTVEMDRDITMTAPRASVWLEIGKHYLGSAVISTVLAGAIRQLGYQARAHVLERDQVVMPLVARDAGLGEIGRIGVLMTPKAGPRVRLGVVTTDFPLETDMRVPDFGTMAFCARCTKCAEACPANAIPLGPPGDADGVARWQLNHEACFTYWNKTGVPCGRCLAVCPLSGTEYSVDRWIKQAARGAAPAQQWALAAHDLFYGSKPRPLAPPAWADAGIRSTSPPDGES